MRKVYLLITCLLIASTGFTQNHPFAKQLPTLDRYIDSLMKEWNIPGLALAVVYKDQMVYAKGFGYRNMENKLPVTAQTLFPIASNTKLFTSTAACILENEGKLRLDEPVRNYMPGLQFNTDELNSKVTLRDMLSHRTGLPRYDGIWIGSPITREQAIEKIKYMKPQLGFREGYIYNNMMFTAAGAVMETVTGTSWESLTRNLLLAPLQMNATCFSDEEMMSYGNFAYAYFEPDSTGKLKSLTYADQSEALGPAGTIKSNMEDMSKWMIAQLNGGKLKGQQAIPLNAINATLVPNTIADKQGKWPELSNSLYALGRTIQTYKGYKITSHTGSIDGFYSNLTLVPSENIGVFLVHNSVPAGSLRSVMAFPLIDRLLQLSATPWAQRYRKDFLEYKAADKKERDSIKATQVKNTSPSHPLIDYTGSYSHPIYNDVIVELINNSLVFSFRKQTSTLHHFHYDQFTTNEQLNGKNDFRVYFLTNDKGDIDKFTMQPFGDPVAEFTKQ